MLPCIHITLRISKEIIHGGCHREEVPKKVNQNVSPKSTNERYSSLYRVLQ